MENEQGIVFFWLGTAVMSVLAMATLSMVFMYQKRLYKFKQKETEKLLLTALQAEQEERKRIASDLHDGILGDISALRNYVAVLLSKQQGEYDKPLLNDFMYALDQTLKNVREVSHNLMPPFIETSTIDTVLNTHFDRLKKWNNVHISTHYDTANLEISSSDIYEIYRIVQELSTNMINHGKAERIYFFMQVENKELVIQISDNGMSFNFHEHLKNSTGLGLQNIMSRVLKIGATLNQLTAEQGNKLEIRLNHDTRSHC